MAVRSSLRAIKLIVQVPDAVIAWYLHGALLGRAPIVAVLAAINRCVFGAEVTDVVQTRNCRRLTVKHIYFTLRIGLK
jgi:hypothetical protein